MSNNGPVNQLDSGNSLSYLNSNQSRNLLWQPSKRDPTVNDRRYKLGTIWTNTTTNNSWQLTSVVNNAANWEPLSQSAGGNAPISKFVVDPDGTGDYTTIQSALTAAGAGPAAIWIRPGTYSGNLVFTLNSNISLVGAVGASDVANQVTITGLHNLPTAGSLMCRNIRFTSATHIFSSSAAGNSTISLDTCNFNLTNGAIFNVVNWVGSLNIRNCTDNSTINSVISNSSGSATLRINSSRVGVGTTSLVMNGNGSIYNSRIGCPTTFQASGSSEVIGSFLDGQMLVDGNAIMVCQHSTISEAGAPAVTYSSAAPSTFSKCVFDSDNTPAFAGSGAGTITFTANDFVNDSNIASTLTLRKRVTQTGDIDVLAVRATNADFTFLSAPNTCTAANTGGVATGVGGDINLLTFQDGLIMEQFVIGTQTIIKPTMANAGLLCSLDLVAMDGVEYNFGAARTTSPFAFTIGTSHAFFFEVTMTVADISGGLPYIIGFRKVEANNATFTAYTDYYAMGMITGTSAVNLSLSSNLNAGGAVAQDSGTAWTGGDGGTVTMRVSVTQGGVTTATIDGAVPVAPLAFTFDATDVVVPYIHLVHGAALPGAVHLVNMKVGLQ